MKNLPLFTLDSVDTIVYPENFKQTTLSSSALDIFTDFKDFKPLVLEGDTLAVDALKLMIKAHVKMKIVISAEKQFLGIITTQELSERHIVMEVAKGNDKAEITVKDLMISREALQAFDYKDIEKSNVSDVIATLKHDGLHVCLVLDRTHHHIRGVISANDIARKLHIPLEISQKSSFSEIFSVLHDQIN